MIKIQIKNEELVLAKEITKEFDAQKTYDKFKCNSNYIGVLGEMVLERYMAECNMSFSRVPFVKRSWSLPDFVINNKNIDLKTTYSDRMWFQKPRHDVYIYAQISKDDKELTIQGMITKDNLIKAISTGTAKQVTRFNRTDNTIEPLHMTQLNDIRELSSLL